MRQIFNFNKTILSLGRFAKQCSLFACLLLSLSTCLLPNTQVFAQTNFQDGVAKIPVEVPPLKADIGFPDFDPEWDGATRSYTPPLIPETPASNPSEQSIKTVEDSPTTRLSSFGA
eukprot:COSAG04_NODE_11158_length_727_cov_1.136943_1_plen_115_part_10